MPAGAQEPGLSNRTLDNSSGSARNDSIANLAIGYYIKKLTKSIHILERPIRDSPIRTNQFLL